MSNELIQALKDITDPISAMQREVPEGSTLNGAMAVHMADSPQWYKNRAQRALDAFAARPVADAGEAVAHVRDCGKLGVWAEIVSETVANSLTEGTPLYAAPSARTLPTAAEIAAAIKQSHEGKAIYFPVSSNAIEQVLAAIKALASGKPAEAPKPCTVCNGTRRVYAGHMFDPPEECDACFDQSPAEAPSVHVQDIASRLNGALNASCGSSDVRVSSITVKDAIRALQGKPEAPKGGQPC